MAASSEIAGHIHEVSRPEMGEEIISQLSNWIQLTYHTFTNWIDYLFLFGFLHHFLIDSRVPLSAWYGGELKGGDGYDLCAFWQSRPVGQLFFQLLLLGLFIICSSLFPGLELCDLQLFEDKNLLTILCDLFRAQLCLLQSFLNSFYLGSGKDIRIDVRYGYWLVGRTGNGGCGDGGGGGVGS